MGTSICSVNYFCFGALLIFVGSVLLCALGFTVVLPYEATRDWPETTCYVINSSYHPHLCSCDRQPTFDIEEFDTCVGKYPCLQIYVRFNFNVSTGVDTRESYESTEQTNSRQVPPPLLPNVSLAGARGHVVLPDGNMSRVLLDPENATGAVVLSNDTAAPATRDIPTVDKNVPAFTDSLGTKYYKDLRGNKGSQSGASSSSAAHEGTIVDATESYTTVRSGQTVNRSTYRVKTLEGESQLGTETLTTILFRSWTDAFYKQCTLHECGDQQWNRQESSRYRVGYGRPGLQYPCYIDPDDPSRVILEKTPRLYMLHAVVWPAVCLSVGTFLWLGLCLGCWKLDSETEAEKYRHRYGALK